MLVLPVAVLVVIAVVSKVSASTRRSTDPVAAALLFSLPVAVAAMQCGVAPHSIMQHDRQVRTRKGSQGFFTPASLVALSLLYVHAHACDAHTRPRPHARS